MLRRENFSKVKVSKNKEYIANLITVYQQYKIFLNDEENKKKIIMLKILGPLKFWGPRHVPIVPNG